MKRSRLADERRRQMGIREATFCVWKKKCANLHMTEIRELRQPLEENAKLKRLVADLSLDEHILGEIVRKRVCGRHHGPVASRRAAEEREVANGRVMPNWSSTPAQPPDGQVVCTTDYRRVARAGVCP